MKKTAVVESNDPQQPKLTLTVQGQVEKFVNISPTVVRLVGKVGDPLQKTITIIPDRKYPFKITSVHAKSGRDIRFSLKEITQANKPGYELTVENLKQQEGRFFDIIYLETTFDQHPQLKISVYGNIVTTTDKTTG
jgi:hypothetical protein